MRGTGRSPAADESSFLDDVQPRKRVQAVKSGSIVPKMGRHLKDPWNKPDPLRCVGGIAWRVQGTELGNGGVVCGCRNRRKACQITIASGRAGRVSEDFSASGRHNLGGGCEIGS